MTKPQTTVVTLVCLTAMSACGGGGSSKSIPIDDLAPELVNAVCALSVRCGALPDLAACKASRSLDDGQVVADVKAGKVIYDGAAARACLDAATALGCSETMQVTTPEPQVCRNIFKGTIAAGGACFSNGECVSQICDRTNCTTAMCCAGSCMPGEVVGLVAIGGDCSAPTAYCGDDAYCNFTFTGTTVTEVCTNRTAAGAACDTTQPLGCAVGSVCIPDTAGAATGVCRALPKEGESCSAMPVFGCDDVGHDVCDANTGMCVRKIAVGGACASGTGCVDDAACDPTTSTCVARGLAGQPCPNAAASCLGSLTCTSAGTCALPPAQPVCQ